MRIAWFCVCSIALTVAAYAQNSQPAGVTFYRTQDSDDWVRHTLIVQKTYKRVLLVSQDAQPPKAVKVAALDLNARDNSASGEMREYPVDRVFATLQEAADASVGGDLVAVAPGAYTGFVINSAHQGAADGSYIHFKALGEPGQVVLNKPSQVQSWMIFLTSTHHIIVEGFEMDGSAYASAPLLTPATRAVEQPATRPATPVATSQPTTRRRPGAPSMDRAGIMLGSGFAQSSLLTHHIILLNNFSHHHGSWGMHSTDTHTVLMQGNCFAFSRQEHSAYVSDGSDNYVIRRNVFFGSRGCGLQCNIDPSSSLRETAANPAMKDFPPRSAPTGTWARKLLARATEIFGENGFPDGLGRNFIIEENVANENGLGGGSAYNFAGLQESLVQNNLAYNNVNHGIALYNNVGAGDTDAVRVASSSPQQVTGPEVLPIFGSHNDVIRNNTILMNNPGRSALVVVNGSYGALVRNNILINDADDSIHTDTPSIWQFDSGYNAAGRAALSYLNPDGYWPEGARNKPGPMPSEFKALAKNLDENFHSKLNLTRAGLAGEFVRDSQEPWVIFPGHWWKLNPNRPDFHPRKDAKTLVGAGDPAQLPPLDNEGQKRSSADIGAFRAAD